MRGDRYGKIEEKHKSGTDKDCIAQLMKDLSDTQRHEVRVIIIGMSLTTAARAEA